MDERRFLTTEEAAERAMVASGTIRRWVRSGRLPAAKPSGSERGHMRIRPEDLDRLLMPAGPARVEQAEPAQAA